MKPFLIFGPQNIPREKTRKRFIIKSTPSPKTTPTPRTKGHYNIILSLAQCPRTRSMWGLYNITTPEYTFDNSSLVTALGLSTVFWLWVKVFEHFSHFYINRWPITGMLVYFPCLLLSKYRMNPCIVCRALVRRLKCYVAISFAKFIKYKITGLPTQILLLLSHYECEF